MCRNATPEAEQMPCWRCGKVANPTDGWEHGWPLTGSIKVGFPSCLPSSLFRESLLAKDKREPELMSPLVDKWGYQDISLSWGPSQDTYRLCYDCQKAFLEVVGDFFFTDTHKNLITKESRDKRQKIQNLEKELAKVRG